MVSTLDVTQWDGRTNDKRVETRRALGVQWSNGDGMETTAEADRNGRAGEEVMGCVWEIGPWWKNPLGSIVFI